MSKVFPLVTTTLMITQPTQYCPRSPSPGTTSSVQHFFFFSRAKAKLVPYRFALFLGLAREVHRSTHRVTEYLVVEIGKCRPNIRLYGEANVERNTRTGSLLPARTPCSKSPPRPKSSLGMGMLMG